MKVYKERQFLIFDFENGKTVKYDFAKKQAIGKSGKVVKDLKTQLSGFTIEQLFECCVDKQYAKFLRFIMNEENYRYGVRISNIGTILDRVYMYSNFEQIFSAGFDDVVNMRDFRKTINEIPKGLVKICRNHDIKLSNNLVDFYEKNPNSIVIAYNLFDEYLSLSDKDVYDAITNYYTTYERYNSIKNSYFNKLIDIHNYNAKALMLYLDRLKTFEAIDNMEYLIRELCDYADMMHKISNKFDKYPRNFLTTHKIASRNYARLKEKFDEEAFQKRINLDMEHTFEDYKFIYPKCTQDIKDEAVQQNNCVASYVSKVINGDCHIMFLRLKEKEDKSLVTIEVREDRIVQALQQFNNPLTEKQEEIVQRWNKWWNNKINNKTKQENEKEIA